MRVNEMPDYIVYSRVTTISIEEAIWLLASFDLIDMNITNADEYNKLLEEKKPLAHRVLFDEENRNFLNFNYVGEPSDIDETGEYYELRSITVKMDKFISLASELNYNIPDILLKPTKKSAGRQTVDNQEVVFSSSAITQPSQNITNKGGKPKGTLAEAVEHAYLKLFSHGNTAVLKADELRVFLKCLKEMATEGNENADEYILERIETVKVPKIGSCSVITKERQIRLAQHVKLEPAKDYKNNAVSKLLTRLRDEHPFTM